MSKKRRLSKKFKRLVGMTGAGLFLVSALLVALIPQRNIKADDPLKETLLDTENQVPTIKSTDMIYTTGDGMFQFAYITKESGADNVAVICGYDYERSLSGGNLQVPDTLDAYMKYTHTLGTAYGYVAASKSGEPLFYEVYEEKKVDTGDVDEDGNPIYELKMVGTGEFLPCYYNTYDKWIVDENGDERIPEKFYYKDGTDYKPCTIDAHQRITKAQVNYLANQSFVKNPAAESDPTEKEWIPNTDDKVGIFSKASNIVNVEFGEHMLGIGNNAFRGCSNLSSITFNDGIGTIGNYSFAECYNLTTVNIPENARVKVIGDHAFYKCRGLGEFTMPTGVEKVGDSCFEDCTAMTSCVIAIPGKNMSLKKLGANVFKGCTKLEKLEFPLDYSEEQLASWYNGCNSLQYIKAPNASLDFKDDSAFTYEDLKAQLPEKFYFEGVKDQALHSTSTSNSIAFKYLDEEIYEKVYNATGDEGTGKTVFQVNDQNQLIFFNMDDTVKKVKIPDTIGPYNITKIGSDSFKENHTITQITIPSSITEIESEAFKGCHNLKDVIFKEPINLTYIGENAFDTQDVDPVIDSCVLPTNPVLTFTGVAKMDSAPFKYAMNEQNFVNNDNQERTYITFYTGWPTNLTVRYNPDTKENELVDCPTLTSLETIGVDTYPYITADMASAAHTAKAAYESDPTHLTDNQKAIVNSAINVDLPDGITAIKEGLFSGLDHEGNVVGTPNKDIVTFTESGLKEIAPYEFAKCENLYGIYLNGPTHKLGDYAFEDCIKLNDVDIYSELDEFGLAPFKGAKKLTEVDFGINKDFNCTDAIIYSMINGNREAILEVLPARGAPKSEGGYGSGYIDKDSFEGVKSVAPSAFEGCNDILSVDFSKSDVIKIPEKCFKDTNQLFSVTLKDGAKSIGSEAFANSNIRYVEIPTSVAIIDNTAFDGDPQQITFYCEEDSAAYYYADNYPNIIVSDKPLEYHVLFYDEDKTYLETVTVKPGQDAKASVTPTKAGYTFAGWFPEPVKIMEDNYKVYATYNKNDEVTFSVTFIDYDDRIITIQDNIPFGGDCIDIKEPTRDGYKFTGWRPAITNIQKDTDVYAQYEKITDDPNKPSDPNDPNKPSDPNDPNGGNNDPSNGGNNGNNGNNNGGNGSSNQLYTVTVVDGSGSGSYVQGASVIITANNPPAGKVFDKWKVDDGVSVLKDTMAATYFTMPGKNVTVTATYKDDKSSNTNNNNGNNGGSGNNGTGNTKPNTTVNLTKPGFSNNNLASATVSGSSDNYVLKITESSVAKAEVEDALLAEYDTLDNIKYVAMDISLYDSTGSAKIENTEDLKVSVTLPIPDDLVQYAGNNKAAYVVNGKLINLDTKFTTINGVPCINFVAPHFSPYTIYVDTKNLSSSVNYTSTSTPKTGDGIGIKWFVSLGLLAMAGLLFAISIPTGTKKKVRK